MTQTTQPRQGMSLTKKVVLTLAGLGLIGTGTAYTNFLTNRAECRRISDMEYNERTLNEEAFYEKMMKYDGKTYFIGLGQYTLRDHPELANQKMKEIVKNKEIVDKYNRNR